MQRVWGVPGAHRQTHVMVKPLTFRPRYTRRGLSVALTNMRFMSREAKRMFSRAIRTRFYGNGSFCPFPP